MCEAGFRAQRILRAFCWCKLLLMQRGTSSARDWRQNYPHIVSALQPDSWPCLGPQTAGWARLTAWSPDARPLCSGSRPGRGKSIGAGCGGVLQVPLQGGSIRSRWVCVRKRDIFPPAVTHGQAHTTHVVSHAHAWSSGFPSPVYTPPHTHTDTLSPAAPPAPLHPPVHLA